MTLGNSRRPYQSVRSLEQPVSKSLTHFHRAGRAAAKRAKFSDKPCPRFTMTGAPPYFDSPFVP